ncbi:DNA repair endonuclease XPF [Periplaneta americana]|uniref:DNA repair endonuclease XPF n=1 Tax=Periplaneta americana TaxID=6978 RepID=UPI0037E73222
MLEYENQIFLDILHEDGLLIAAKGLGIETIFLNLLKVYCDPGNLVIVVGTTSKEEEFYITQLEAEGVKPLPKVITTEYTAADRDNVYLEGGVLFVSSRILVVDLLKERIPISHVTGFLVSRAHTILESCQEAFAIRLYRQKNKTGFVKAFSSSPQAFTVGFAQVEHIMRTLFVRNLYLWPRFHATVNASLEKCKPQVVELHLPLTSAMLEIQTAVLDLMNLTVKELKRINQTLDTDELTVENAISKSFHKILQLQLDPIWHQLSMKTKQLVADLKTLRLVLTYLTKYDCITFNTLVNSLRSTEYAMKSSGWLMLDSAETLFVVSKQRVLGMKQKKEEQDEPDIQPEVNPKWQVLSEVLEEIDGLSKKICEKDSTYNNKVLVLVEDSRTCNQLKQYLTVGAEDMLHSLYEKAFRCSLKKSAPQTSTKSTSKPAEPVEEKNEVDDSEENKESYILSQKVKLDSEEKIITDIKEEPQYVEYDQGESEGIVEGKSAEPFKAPVVVLQTFKKYGDPLALSRSLHALKPRFVVMYDADMATVRRLEVYQSSHPEFQLRVYFLMYGGSVEEQAFLTSLRREKEAFDFLIKEKASMVVPESQDGKSEDCAELSRDPSRPNLTIAPSSSRKGGKDLNSKEKKPAVVVVDMREFRSDLPSLIHRRGIDIEPVTLQVGDYILTPELCVERKSVSDLIGSLNSGRLYNQALSMTRHYAKPMLLIEFDQNKPFALQGSYYVSNDITSNDVAAKLQLLTLHFPKLKLVWSPSPYATAQLFEELKQGREEPDPTAAAAIGMDIESELESEVMEKWNTAIHDLVTKLPGVTTKNQRLLLLKGQSLDHLLTLSKDELTELVNNSGEAQSLFDGLHKVYQSVEEPEIGSKFFGRGRGKTRVPFKRRKI